jgi:hypothetical protein
MIFFTVFPLDRNLPVGEHFTHLYSLAARAASPDEILHLAYIDRLSFALRGNYRGQFLRDVCSLYPEDLPLIFLRSENAWQTHPQNYFEIEHFITTMGKILFGTSLDYAWCHLVIQAAQLEKIMRLVRSADLSMVAEMILLLQSNIKTQEVDWLAWEDPFVLQRDPEELKHEREKNPEETQKRFSYATRMVEAMVQFALKHQGLA